MNKNSDRKGPAQQIESSPTGYGYVAGNPKKSENRKGSLKQQ